VARRVLALILLGLALIVCVALAASESLTNRTGRTATAVTVTFSEQVRITSYNEAVFPTKEPSSRSETFRFSGGQLEDGARFAISWAPSGADITSTEWETTGASAATSTPRSPNARPEYDAIIGPTFDRSSSDGVGGAILIPNLGIKSEELRMSHTTFLELLRRNTGNEVEAVHDLQAIIGLADTLHHGWGGQITVDVGWEWNGMNKWAEQVIDEINAGLGRPYFRKVQGSSAEWVFDFSAADWKEDRNIEESVRLSSAGDPASCRFRVSGIFRFENDFKTRLRAAVVRTILLYADYDPALLSHIGYDTAYFEKTGFSADFLNLLSVLADLPTGRDFAPDQNEVNRSPVAVLPHSMRAYVGEEAVLDAQASFDVDGKVVGLRWVQLAPTKLGPDYTTSERVQLAGADSSTALFTPQWPGTYRFLLSVEDGAGAGAQATIGVDVVWRENLLPRYRGISASEYYEADSYRQQKNPKCMKNNNLNHDTL